MGYMRRKWKSLNQRFIIDEKYHSLRSMPHNPLVREKRQPRSGNGTSESQRRTNLRRRTEKLFRQIMDNFEVGAWYISFNLSEMVTKEKFEKEYDRMMQTLRRFWTKHGWDLKYIAVIENLTGPGRMHGHVLVPGRVNFAAMKKLMAKAWKLGDAYIKPYGGDAMDARKLAAYYTKEDISNKKLDEMSKEEFDAMVRGMRGRIRTSTKLITREPEKKSISTAETYREEIRAPKGYHVVKELSYGGWTAAGYPYQRAVYERDW